MIRINNTNNLLTILKFFNNIDYYPILSFFSYLILLTPNNQFIQQTNKQTTTKQIPSTRISTRLLLLILSSLLLSHPLPPITTHPTKKLSSYFPSLPPRNIERSNERTETKVKVSICLGADLQVDWAAY